MAIVNSKNEGHDQDENEFRIYFPPLSSESFASCLLPNNRKIKMNYINMFHLPCIKQIQKYIGRRNTPCPYFMR
jgi:hypothetical protein